MNNNFKIWVKKESTKIFIANLISSAQQIKCAECPVFNTCLVKNYHTATQCKLSFMNWAGELKTFKESYLSGICALNNIDDYVRIWSLDDNTLLQLHEYLGMTTKEYDRWLVNRNSLDDIAKNWREVDKERKRNK